MYLCRLSSVSSSGKGSASRFSRLRGSMNSSENSTVTRPYLVIPSMINLGYWSSPELTCSMALVTLTFYAKKSNTNTYSSSGGSIRTMNALTDSPSMLLDKLTISANSDCEGQILPSIKAYLNAFESVIMRPESSKTSFTKSSLTIISVKSCWSSSTLSERVMFQYLSAREQVMGGTSGYSTYLGFAPL